MRRNSLWLGLICLPLMVLGMALWASAQFGGPVTVVVPNFSAEIRAWRPEVERVNVQTMMPTDTTGLFMDVRFENASTHLGLPTTPAEDDQCLHPDVVYAPQGFGGHNWWMVMTPFPLTNAGDYELPEILCSDTGLPGSWAAPAGLTNPIFAHVKGEYHADPSLLLHNSVLYCFFLHVTITPVNRVVCMTSRDGVAWSGPSTVIDDYAANLILAPVVRNVKGTFYMWCVDRTAGINAGVVKRRSSSSPLGPYSAAETCTLNGIGIDRAWHVNVQQFGDKYLMVGTFNPAKELYLGVSTDGLTFNCQEIFYVNNSRGSWDDAGTYQASLVQCDDGSYDLFYGGLDTAWDDEARQYKIGRGKLTPLPHPRYNKTPLVRSLEILGSECVGFWPFLESSGTAMVDLTGLHNFTASEDYGRFDTAPVQRMPVHYLKLNGTDEGAAMALDDDHFSFSDGKVDSAFSVGAWVKIAGAINGEILNKYDDTGAATPSNQEWRFDLLAGRPTFILNDDGVGQTAYEGRTADAAISVNVWHHVVITSNAGIGEAASDSMVIYVDGAAVASSVYDGAGAYVAMENLTAPLRLDYGIGSAGAGGWFAGSTTMLAVTGKNLTAWEVRMLYEYQKLLMGL